ncbi:MAG: endonuclease/exonuclease/phosphatase family protein [Rubrimonas sp.]
MAGRRLIGLLAAALAAVAAAAAEPPPPAPPADPVAAINTGLSRDAPRALIQEMRQGGSPQIHAVVEIIQRVRPDILLITEIDLDPRGVAPKLLAHALRTGRNGAAGIDYPYSFTAPVNAGVMTGYDLDGDGRRDGPRDAHGEGRFEGQHGMAILSRHPIGAARTFQTLRWADTPGHHMPDGRYILGAARDLRLSSTSHWDVRIKTPGGPLHLLASHPTPPLIDGPGGAAAHRNADEVAFWIAYLDGAAWIADDAGGRGGAGPDPVVLLGDLKVDPVDGGGFHEPIMQLLAHPRLQDPQPGSEGSLAEPDPRQRGDQALHTVMSPRPGALRVDYVLPDVAVAVTGAGVFWPGPNDPLRRLVGDGDRRVSSEHRLVWADVVLPQAEAAAAP